jgi:hypothetical protein
MDDPCARGERPKHSELDPDFVRTLRSKGKHDEEIDYGENIWSGMGKEKAKKRGKGKKKKMIKDVSGQYVVKRWYNEKANYISHSRQTGEYSKIFY